MKEFKASVRLSRWQSNMKPYSGWTLEITNYDNGTPILRVELDNDAIADLLSSQAARSEAVVFDEEGVDRIGYERESATMFVPEMNTVEGFKSMTTGRLHNLMAAYGYPVSELWDFSVDKDWNVHRRTDAGYRVHVYRWVPVS